MSDHQRIPAVDFFALLGLGFKTSPEAVAESSSAERQARVNPGQARNKLVMILPQSVNPSKEMGSSSQ